MMRSGRTTAVALAVLVALAACSGSRTSSVASNSNSADPGSDSVASNPNDGELPITGVDPLEEVNVILLSDAIFDLDDRRARVRTWECREDLSFICTARLGRLEAYADPRGEFTYQVLGEWEHLFVAGVIYDGTTLFASAAGVSHENSLPAGGATWIGNMVGVHRPPETPLDEAGRLVRGGAEITLPNLRDPAVDVTLTPRGLPVLTWIGVPSEGSSFHEEWAVTTDAPHPGPPNRASYIRGEFYGPNAEEVGGVFERAGIIGAFGAKHP